MKPEQREPRTPPAQQWPGPGHSRVPPCAGTVPKVYKAFLILTVIHEAGVPGSRHSQQGGDDCSGFLQARAGGQGPGGESCYVPPRWAAEASRGLGFLEENWKMPAPSPPLTLPQPQTSNSHWPDLGLDTRRGGCRAHGAGQDRFPRSWARVRDWPWEALRAPWKARTHVYFWKKTQP